jgi:AcrR family transcriptional regulator
MDAFLNLRAEKQEHIINAALNVFGRNGYRKASVADIAEGAGMAKGMINYYFGSKKNLYLYLAELSFKKLTGEIEKRCGGVETDFFAKMKRTTEAKVAAIRDHPALLSFLASLYAEKDGEVCGDIAAFLAEGMKFRERWLFGDVDFSKFRDDVDPKLLDRFLVWAAEGFTNGLGGALDYGEIERMTDDLFKILDLMRKYFYKNEYLREEN